MSYTNSLNPRLPLDLERIIFELAVSQNGAKHSTPLLLVAKRVREWTAPLIFRVLNQIWPTHSPDLTRFPQLLQSVGPLVQHLMVDSYSANDSFQTVLSSCPNVRNLALYLPTTWEVSRVEAELNSLLFVLQNMPRLTRLSVSLPTRSMSYADLLIRPFLNLTHVEILFPSASSHSWGKCDILTQSPKLTHLSIEGTIQVHDVLKLLHRPRLKVLIVVPSDRGRQDLDALYRVEDNRLVLLEELNYVDVIFDWEKGANGGVDTWMFAELVAFARGRGYFLTKLPNRIPRSFDDWEINLNEEGKQWFSELRLNKH